MYTHAHIVYTHTHCTQCRWNWYGEFEMRRDVACCKSLLCFDFFFSFCTNFFDHFIDHFKMLIASLVNWKRIFGHQKAIAKKTLYTQCSSSSLKTEENPCNILRQKHGSPYWSTLVSTSVSCDNEQSLCTKFQMLCNTYCVILQNCTKGSEILEDKQQHEKSPHWFVDKYLTKYTIEIKMYSVC